MKVLLLDECVDFRIVKELRKSKYEVFSILEDLPGADDIAVLEYSDKKSALLITEDKDFGELTIRFQKATKGILLLRILNKTIDVRKKIILEALDNHHDEMVENFAVLSESKLRIKTAHNI